MVRSSRVEAVLNSGLAFFDQADERGVMRVHVHESRAWIGCGSTPVHTTCSTRELDRGLRRRAILMKPEWRERAGVIEASAPVPELLARAGVFRRGIRCADHVFLRSSFLPPNHFSLLSTLNVLST